MRSLFLAGLASLAVASCSGKDRVASFEVTSEFGDKQPIPARLSCEGDNKSPAVKWSGAPASTKGYAVFLDDPDAPNHVFHHWAVFGIPSNVSSLAAAAGGSAPAGGKLAVNDSGSAGYFGPCPPHAGAPHTYHLKVLALDTADLQLPPNPTAAEVEAVADTHVVARGEITGTFGRK